ncbi:DUF3962 domain-containing protein [Falcatimonas sp. MSJ-15]|uniref:pPIWI_RE module domain-containing protein n=1 Tax=Falcatimonas sp. MSJ-15 TaxID=2841515 RepID=UPI001C10126C|nr:DUF3962 domain-containing protein [Falcatimonas sp. MSJ-15]MBU5470553.1 DUF3962 domain-containing protein [Falcatimonas sp. MSJ-15]
MIYVKNIKNNYYEGDVELMNPNYIIPMTLVLDKKIEKEVHFLTLPGELKESLTRLEELSRNGQDLRGRFIREKHNLPLNSLKKMFITYMPGVTDMKAVGYNTDDRRWLISVDKIDAVQIVQIIRVWIDAFYIQETELDKIRNNDNNTKKYAQEVIDRLNADIFNGCEYTENIVLFANGEVADKDAYSLLPLIAVNELVSTEVTVGGKHSVWMYSDKNQIVTNPLAYTGKGGKERFSFVASFSVQTLPPYNRAYLNVNISSRRWISHNNFEKIPYYRDEKSVYAKVSGNKLQHMYAKYDATTSEFEWTYADQRLFRAMYATDNVVKFNDIIIHPEEYSRGQDYMDYYIVYEYGMKIGKTDMNDQDAGISVMDRREIFSDIENKLNAYSSGEKQSWRTEGTDSLTKSIFTSDFLINEEYREIFENNVAAICGDGGYTVEVCYSSGQEEIRDALCERLQVHFKNTKVVVNMVLIRNLTENLVCEDSKKKKNNRGYHQRIKEVYDELGMAVGPTISIVIIHNQDYYKINGITDSKADPKAALRMGFAKTGRLTQFITVEAYRDPKSESDSRDNKQKKRKKSKEIEMDKLNSNDSKKDKPNMVLKSTILDVYRQVGIHNSAVKVKRKGGISLWDNIKVGIHVVNYKNLMNDVNIAPFPLIVSCDFANEIIMVQTELIIMSKITNRRERVEKINCRYDEFPLKICRIITELESGKRIIPSEHFIKDWFEGLVANREYEIMMLADGVTRRIVSGITNKEIKDNYCEETGNVYAIGINSNTRDIGFTIKLDDYSNVQFLRIRANDEVPDYILMENDTGDGFKEGYGIYSFENVYYSKDARPEYEKNNIKEDITKINNDSALSHRSLIEIYPVYLGNSQKKTEYVRDIHNLRKASIQYDSTQRTLLPLPLHLAKLLEEYLI